MRYAVEGATLTFASKYKQTARKLSFMRTAAVLAGIQIATTRTQYKLVQRHILPHQRKGIKKCSVPERV